MNGQSGVGLELLVQNEVDLQCLGGAAVAAGFAYLRDLGAMQKAVRDNIEYLARFDTQNACEVLGLLTRQGCMRWVARRATRCRR